MSYFSCNAREKTQSRDYRRYADQLRNAHGPLIMVTNAGCVSVNLFLVCHNTTVSFTLDQEKHPKCILDISSHVCDSNFTSTRLAL